MKPLLTLFLWAFIFSTSWSYSLFTENGKVGLKNDEGLVLIPAVYDGLGWSNGTFSVKNNITGYFQNNLWGLIRTDNEKLTAPLYEEILPVDGEIFIARKKLSPSVKVAMGCINSAGKVVIPFQYDGIKIENLRAIVFSKIGDQYKYGLIDMEHRTLIPQQYKYLRSLGNLRYAITSFQNKIGLFDDTGRAITPFDVDSIGTFAGQYAVLHRGFEKGVISRDGKIVVQPALQDVQLNQNKILVKEMDIWEIRDGQNSYLKSIGADSLIHVHGGIYKVVRKSASMLVNEDFQTISPVCQFISSFVKGKTVGRLNGLEGIIGVNGKWLVPPANERAIVEDDHFLIRHRVGDKLVWHLTDTTGSVLSKAYDGMTRYGNGYLVTQRGRHGLINSRGKEVLGCSYDEIAESKENLYVVKFQGAYGIVAAHDEWKVAPQAFPLQLISANRYLEMKENTFVLKSIDGDIIYFTTNPIKITTNYLLEHVASGEVWKIDMRGRIVERNVVHRVRKEEIFDEREGLRAIFENGKYGFIDSQDRLRIANRYEDVGAFHEGLAAVKILGKWGFINKKDNIAVQPVYDEVFPYANGRAIVRQNTLFGMIDPSGKLVLPVRYETIEELESGNFKICQNRLWGLADATGKIIITPRYHRLIESNSKHKIVMRDSKYGVVTENGVNTIPIAYDNISYNSYRKVFLTLTKSNWKELSL